MNREELLVLYDREQRFEVSFPGFRREEVGNVVRFEDKRLFDVNFVLYSKLSADNADAAIQEQVQYFGKNGRSFEWKLYDHDTPPDLRQRLEKHGFTIGEEEAIMVLDLAQAPEELRQPAIADVRRLTEPSQIEQVVAVEYDVWADEDIPLWGKRLAAEMQEAPDFLSIYVAYVDDDPACAGWLNFSPNSQFASLWGGSTKAKYRKQGLYTAVLAARVQEAIQRGYRYLTIDASPMSRPIVAKHGFQLLTTAYEANWEPKK